MAWEIERRFIVISNEWQHSVEHAHRIIQGYFPTESLGWTQRIRIIDDKEAILTLKIRGSHPGIRQEYEYPLPLEDAQVFLECMCRNRIVKKKRHRLNLSSGYWIVDVFEDKNSPLVLAEWELKEWTDMTPNLPWIGQEVTSDPRYTNSYLAVHPYSSWRSN